MPLARVKMPDGRVALVRASTPEEAVAFAKNGFKPVDARKADYDRTRADAAKEDKARRARSDGPLEALAAPLPLPLGDEIRGGGAALVNTVKNLGRRATGQPTVDTGAVYEAYRDADMDYDAETRRRHPVTSTVGSLLAGLGKSEAAGLAVKAPSFLKGLAQASGMGAGMGGVYGLGEGRNVEERVDNAVKGAASGAVVGGLLHGVAAPVVRGGSKVVKDVVTGIKAKTAKPPPPGPVVPTEQEAASAAAAAVQLAAKKGIKSGTVAERAAPYEGKDVMAAELLGSEGVNQLAATARRGGETGDNVRAAVRNRSTAAADRIRDDFAEHLGISPDQAAGDIEAMVEAGQARAKPLYDRALGGEEGVTSSRLESLEQRPSVREAMGEARRDALDRGEDFEGLHMGRVERPQAVQEAPAPGFDESVPAGPPRGPAAPPGRGRTLSHFVAENGGIAKDGGELAASGADQLHRGKAYRGRLAGGTQDADHAVEAAWEAGYFPDYPPDGPPPPRNALWDALDEEARGRPRYGREADPEDMDRYRNREGYDEQVYRGGDPEDVPHEDAYGGAPGPEFEPAEQVAPRAATWDAVKKKIDQLIQRGPDGKPVMDGPVGQQNRRYLQVAQDLREELTRAIPGYREALAESGDYMAVRGAFGRLKGKLTTGSVRDFGKAWAALKTPAEQEAGRAALANDVLELYGKGHLRGAKFDVPGIRAKLELAFNGKGNAAKFIEKMEVEAQLAASGNRAAPYSGSPTMGLQEAAAEQNAAANVDDVARIAGKFGSGKFGSGLADTAVTGVKRAIGYGRTAGMSEGMRNEYGRILQMGPDEFARFLAKWESLPETVQRRFPIPAGMLGGRVSGQAVSAQQRDR